MTVTRRSVLKGAAGVAGLYAFSPWLSGAFATASPQAAGRRRHRVRRRLVVIDLGGGNDGLNMVVPRTGARRAVYEQVRPSIKLPVDSLLPLDRGGPDDGSMGLHASLPTVHRLYREDRVAVVQGVDYPNHNYSHFTSNDIWQAGNPDNIGDTGWLGRHLDRVGVAPEEIRAVGVGGTLPHALRGRDNIGSQINSLYSTHFLDGASPLAVRRHDVYRGFAGHTTSEPNRHTYGALCAATVTLDEDTTGLTAAQPGGLASSLLTARTLLTADLGVEIVFVSTGGYDTHAGQTTLQEQLFADLDQALEAFYYGTKAGAVITSDGTATGTPIGPVDPAIRDRTLFMTFSEFGRRIGENASGTDHGAAAPMLFIGPPAATAAGMTLVPGLHSDHPDVGTTTLPADNLAMTTDLRSVYQAVLTHWLRDETGPCPDEGDPAFRLTATGVDTDGSLTGLFA
jgi:uncharacterized protein (DUF1501 family)